MPANCRSRSWATLQTTVPAAKRMPGSGDTHTHDTIYAISLRMPQQWPMAHAPVECDREPNKTSIHRPVARASTRAHNKATLSIKTRLNCRRRRRCHRRRLRMSCAAAAGPSRRNGHNASRLHASHLPLCAANTHACLCAVQPIRHLCAHGLHKYVSPEFGCPTQQPQLCACVSSSSQFRCKQTRASAHLIDRWLAAHARGLPVVCFPPVPGIRKISICVRAHSCVDRNADHFRPRPFDLLVARRQARGHVLMIIDANTCL